MAQEARAGLRPAPTENVFGRLRHRRRRRTVQRLSVRGKTV
jgi:hypothetical protein